MTVFWIRFAEGFDRERGIKDASGFVVGISPLNLLSNIAIRECRVQEPSQCACDTWQNILQPEEEPKYFKLFHQNNHSIQDTIFKILSIKNQNLVLLSLHLIMVGVT